VQQSVLTVDSKDAPDLSTIVDSEDGMSAVEVSSCSAVETKLTEESIDCVVTGYEIEDDTGMDVVDTVRAESPQTPVVLYTDVSPGEIDTASFEDLIVERSSVEVSTQDFLQPVVGVESQAEEVQITL